MKAVVMAGGEGSRLRPITSNRPKPLVPICNVPIMEHILVLLKRHGITHVVPTLHYLADEIQGYFGDGSDFDVEMEYSIEDTPLGTAGSVKKGENLIRGSSSREPFLIISGDALTDCDISKALEFHKAKGSLATIILYRVPTPLDFGVVITDDEGRIVRFLEKPGWSEVFSDTVNTGMYILEPEIFDYMEQGRNYDWSSDIFPRLLEEGKPMFGYVMEEYWCDVGSHGQYREAQEHLMSGRVDLPIPSETRGNNTFIGANPHIDDTASIVPPVVIGRNCKIKKGARIGPYTVLGDNTLIEEEATVERSIIWDSAYIGASVSVRSAVVGSRATIKRDCIISEDAVVGDRCLIDVGCTVRPRIKLWPDKIIERGSTVTMSLVWGNKWRGNLFRELGVAGLSNIEVTPDFACRLGSAYGSCMPPKSRIVTSRDSTRSSRMIKRALIASLLSVGCDILDLRSLALPVARHYIRKSGAAGAVNVRKLPGNARVTLIELLDQNGGYLSRNTERKVESAFFREDFKRIDSEDLGVIEPAGPAVEGYQQDFFNQLGRSEGKRRLKIACDYGYSSLATFYPAMLARLNVESISLNGFNDAKMSPRTADEVAAHVENLRHIVSSLGYDMGILFTEEGERLTVVDERGRDLVGNSLLAALAVLVGKTHEDATIAMSITAPTRLEEALKKAGTGVVRTKSDVRSLMNASLENHVTFAGDDRGGFIFPTMHPGFDAPFSCAKLITMLQNLDLSLAEVADELPQFQVAYEVVRCPWEAKGAVMRQISEESAQGERVELVDGIKIFDHDSWVLVLPDALEPIFHIYAESPEQAHSRELVDNYARKIEQLQLAV
ncbi:MAG: NTP transferase domain-containing protein [Fimbriimonadaceae bacterium]|nr:NTP transferase domain-containing protein [Fimbriimonadaceae bacterium]